MFEWHRTIQKMINIIEDSVKDSIDEDITLERLADVLGYSKFHVTKRFADLTGTTFRDYLRQRRLAYGAGELRDTRMRILDIAVKYGFSSQEAFTRAFKYTYGITPAVYRKKRTPLYLGSRRNIFDPYYLGIGESSMSKSELQNVTSNVVTLPAHKFLHIKNAGADNYFGFWALQEKIPGQGCDTICGLLDSIAGKLDSVTGKIGEFDGQIGGYFFTEEGKKGYVYGIRLPADYKGELPLQMLVDDVPKCEYIVFSHPPFDYEKIGGSVCEAVEKAADSYEFQAYGYSHDKTAVTYQMHSPNHLGYRLYVPVVKL